MTREEIKAQQKAKKDRVAELMSIGLTTVQIRTRLGMTNGGVQRIIRSIRDDLGPQAV